MQLGNNLDFAQYPAKNFRCETCLSTGKPSNPFVGQIIYLTDTNVYNFYNGSSWIEINNNTAADTLDGFHATYFLNTSSGAQSVDASKAVITNLDADKLDGKHASEFINTSSGTQSVASGKGTITNLDADKLDTQDGAYYLSRSNHSGTQLASTISDFNTQVRTNRLDQMAIPTASVSMNSQTITNLGTPSNPNDAVNMAYVNAVAQGLKGKDAVTCATTANITLSGTQTIDGIALSVSDRVLVKNQTLAKDNGIYAVAAGAWSRVLDANTWTNLVSAYVFVSKGTTLGDTGWLCTIDAGGVLGTNDVTWTQFSSVSTILDGDGLTKSGNTLNVNPDNTTIYITSDTVAVKGTSNTEPGTVKIKDSLRSNNSGVGVWERSKYAITIGDGTATNFTITHNLNTQDVHIMVYRVASPYDIILPDIQLTSANTATIIFGTAPSNNQFRVVAIA